MAGSVEQSGKIEDHFWRLAWHDLRLGIGLGGMLAWANLRVQRRRSLLSLFWLFAPAAFAAAGASYVQARGLMVVRAVGMPYPIFAFAGAVAWQAFVEALNAPARMLAANRTIITRMRVSHEGFVIAGLAEVAIYTMARGAILIGLCILLGYPLAGTVVLAPLAMIGLIVFGAAIGLMIAPFILLYDDISRAVLLAGGALIVLAPVAYPIRQIGWQRFNPLIPLVDLPRALVVGATPATDYLIAASTALLLLLLAWPLYRIARPHVVARLG